MNLLNRLGLSLEEKLIISILKKNEIDQNLFEKINWIKFVNISIRENIFPVIYLFFYEKPHLIPGEFLNILKFLYLKNKERTDFFIKESENIFEKFKKGKIFFVPLRGLYLAEEIYGEPHNRVFADIDIYIREDEVIKVVKILEEEGFHFKRKAEEINILKNFPSRFYTEYNLFKDNLMIELHFDFLPPRFKYKIKKNEFTRNLRRKKFGKIEIFIPAREWEYILLCFNAFIHRLGFLRFIYDIHLFAEKQKEKIDYEYIKWVGERGKFLKIIKLMSSIASNLFNTCIPSFLKFPAPPLFFFKFIFREKDPHPLYKDMFYLLSIDNFSQKLHYLISLLLPDERMYEIFPLPLNFFFLYYPLRIFIIIKNRLKFNLFPAGKL